MGFLQTLESLKERVIKGETYDSLRQAYELQDETNRQLNQTVKRVNEENVQQKETIERLNDELQSLKEKLPQYNWKIVDGIAYKKTDGTYLDTPFCPNCKLVMCSVKHRRYSCSGCGHSHKVELLPDVVARNLNLQSPRHD